MGLPIIKISKMLVQARIMPEIIVERRRRPEKLN